MYVAVDHAGEQRPTICIYDFGAIRHGDLSIVPYGNDATVLDENGRISDRVSSGAINQDRATKSA
jgi:hypothetical protein